MDGPASRAVGLLLTIVCLLTIADGLRFAYHDQVEFEPIPDFVVNVNSDSPETLQLLPGIGPVIGQRILEQRARFPFEGPEDFSARVRGIGPVFLASFGRWLDFRTGTEFERTAQREPIDDQRLVQVDSP